jgi:hypothetical protein
MCFYFEAEFDKKGDRKWKKEVDNHVESHNTSLTHFFFALF